MSPRTGRHRRAARSPITLALLCALPTSALANPNGGVVQSGVATITGQGTSRVDIQQASQGAVLSWEHFNIKAGELTQFHQPNANAVAINKILQQDPSQIFGALQANGNVYLINPNGFLFGSSAQINTRGFVAATSAEDLMKVPNGFDAGSRSAPGAKIENHGAISSGDGGFVYLVAPRIENGKDAVITTPNGEVLLAAGATVTLTDDPRGVAPGIKYTAPGEPGGEAVNLGKLVADGGFARMRADIVHQGGTVQANAVRERDGKIELYAKNDLVLDAGSRTAATGGEGSGRGGTITATSDDHAEMNAGAVVDVSGGAAGGDAGKAELSAKGAVTLAGTFRAGAKAGSKRGSVTIDPSQLTIDDGTSFVGAGAVVAEATDRIIVAPNTTIELSNDAQAGDGTAARQSLTLRSGRHIAFGSNSKIDDDGTGAGGAKIWDVNLVGGADLASGDLLATRPGSDGGVYLSGANFDSSGAVTTIRSGNGEVALTRGDLTVRAAGDVVIGNGGGLKDQRGAIDVAAGRDVLFKAGSTTDDGVIENGSGDIHVRAGGSVRLGVDPNLRGNAAIRTRGVVGTDAQGQTTVTDGGDITIEAGGDVDAGVGNRWLEPGPDLSPDGYRERAAAIGIPDDYVPPNFDPMPVVRDGILGIGTEAGGNVTIVAGGSVRTGESPQPRSGATASGLGTQYNGSHIGVFGTPVTRVVDDVNAPSGGSDRNVPIEGAASGKLIVVAGDSIAGDYVERGGDAELRAGYALAPGVDARTLDAAHLDASLVESTAATSDGRAGWFGTLADPVTVDTIEASITGAGRNGVALRAIENPTLVYPPNSAANGVTAVPTWRETDAATLRSSHGDVILVGNDIVMPVLGSQTSQPNFLVRLLPPNVDVETERGDLVLLNDFSIFPSANGGLTLNVGGEVRTAGFASATPATLSLDFQTIGATGDRAFSVSPGTKLRDPATGLTYTVTREITVTARAPANPTHGAVVFRVTPSAAGGTVVVPRGTRVAAQDGQVYQVTQDAILPPPEQRFSTGTVTFFATGGGAAQGITIPANTEFIGPGGVRFQVQGGGQLAQGATQVTFSVRAVSPGVDAPAFGLTLATPIPGIDRASNFAATARPAEITADVQAVQPGTAGNAMKFEVTGLLDRVPGIEGIVNRNQLLGGTDLAPAGIGTIPELVRDPLVQADVFGPAGEAPSGTRLVIADPSQLPAGVHADEIVAIVKQIISAPATPSIYRTLRPDGNGGYRADPAPGTVETADAGSIWSRDGNGTSARIVQSDAFPQVDARNKVTSFDYATYFSTCRSGLGCSLGTFGTAPTHEEDPSTAWLRAIGGFERVGIDLAKPAFALTGDAGPDGVFGTPDDGDRGSIFDFALITQHSRSDSETVLWVPIGDASFGAVSPAPTVLPDLTSGLQVAGPGKASLLVGVLPNAPQVDRNGNGRIDAEESAGDRNGDGHVDTSEWRGDPETFTNIDEAQREYVLGSPGSFVRRTVPAGAGDQSLTPAESPFVPSGSGGSISLAAAISPSLVQSSLGISTVGNVRNPTLPLGSATLVVAADGDIDLGGRGSIETYQGGAIQVTSVSGGLRAGVPPPDFNGRRGIVTLFREPGFNAKPAQATGGGRIGIDVEDDFTIGGLAVAALSGNDIAIVSRDGSIEAGAGAQFSAPSVFVSPSGELIVNYEGAGISAGATGNIDLIAKQDIRIGAGITGQNVNIDAGGSLVGGTGGITAGNVSINVTGTIGGSISASGSINVAGGSVSQGTSLSAGGIVSGAGAGVGSNAGAGKSSSEVADLSNRAAEVGAAAGLETARKGACDPQKENAGMHCERHVVIKVTSRVIN